jgi:TM2 domain-containing membrane protein YozV
MEIVGKLLNQPKSRKVAVILALLTTVLPIPIAGVHKFYLGQPLWGIIYLLLGNTPISRIASAIDAVWYLIQDAEQFNCQFNHQPAANVNLGGFDPSGISAVAEALRELDRLREDGLVTEYEFEQKRRQLLDRMA